MFREIFIVFFLPFSSIARTNGYVPSTTTKRGAITAFAESTTIKPETNGTSVNETLVCPVSSKPCFSTCCQIGTIYAAAGNCSPLTDSSSVKFPKVYDSLTHAMLREEIRIEDFHIFTRDPCHGRKRYDLIEDQFEFLSNGSIYETATGKLLHFRDYCLAAVNAESWVVIRCLADKNETTSRVCAHKAVPIGMIISATFFLLTFIVYTVIPELRNMHGRTLRGYVASLAVSYVVLAYLHIASQKKMNVTVCNLLDEQDSHGRMTHDWTDFFTNFPTSSTIVCTERISWLLSRRRGFIEYFSCLASFFWLNVMSFDIWWTFRSMQGTVRQGEARNFIGYSIYVWGLAGLLTGICVLMDYVPGIPDSFIKPKFAMGHCWFTEDSSVTLYLYGPMSITVLCNIFFFMSTSFTIIRHKKNTAHHLQGMDSRRHDGKKQWFKVYLKLFIVMGISWSMEIIGWFCRDSSKYIWCITDLINSLQGVIIFVIFVWKDKTRRLVLKRLGRQMDSYRLTKSSKSADHRSASGTSTATVETVPLEDKNNPYEIDRA